MSLFTHPQRHPPSQEGLIYARSETKPLFSPNQTNERYSGVLLINPYIHSSSGICIKDGCRECRQEENVKLEELKSRYLIKYDDPSCFASFKKSILILLLKVLEGQNLDLESYRSQVRELPTSNTEAREALFFNIQQLSHHRIAFLKDIQDTFNHACRNANFEGALASYEKTINLECKLFRKNLPAYGVKNQILMELNQRDNPFCLLIGETGSGKTTQTPQFLYQRLKESGIQQKIICVQPRKVAAVSLAKRVAEELGVKLGEEVGYQISYFDLLLDLKDIDKNAKRTFSSKTQVLFVTESVLLRWMIAAIKNNDPTSPRFFSSVKAILLDEIHERSLLSDIIFGIAKMIFIRQYPSIKIFLTSATIDTNKFSSYFNNCRILEIKGRTFPIEMIYKPIAEDNYIKGTIDTLKEIVKAQRERRSKYDGHIIVFLTGIREMEDVQANILRSFPSDFFEDYVIHFLHGSLPDDKQQQVFQHTEKTKIILSTKIAESSITVNGIKIVIDSGYDKDAFYDTKRGVTILETNMITKASAQQRRGRAGRTAPGVCYRLYSQPTFDSFKADKLPEISKMDLANVVLRITDCGLDPLRFPYLEPPSEKQIADTLRALAALEAVDNANKITKMGKIMLEMSTELKVTRLLVQASQRGCLQQAIQAIAVEEHYKSLYIIPDEKEERKEFRNNRIRYKGDHKSDYLDFLTIYEQWQWAESHGTTTKWYDQNQINKKVLMKIQRRRDELNKEIHIINDRSQNLQYFMKQKEELTAGSIQERLLKSIFSSYVMSMGKSSGSRRIGCIDITNGFEFQIHCSSNLIDYSLSLADINNFFIVYSRMTQDNLNLAQGVSMIPTKWIDDPTIIGSAVKKEILNNMAMNYNIQHKVVEMPSWAVKMYWKMFRDRIQKVSDEMKSAGSIFELDTFAKHQSIVYIYRGVQGVDEFNNQLKQELDVEVLKEHFLYNLDGTNYSAVFKDGLSITELLLPHEFISASYSISDGNRSQDDVIRLLELNKDKVAITTKYNNNGTNGMISFENKEEARNYVQQSHHLKACNISPPNPLNCHIKNMWKKSYTIQGRYSIARSKCEAKVTFNDVYYANIALQRLNNSIVDGSQIHAEGNKKNPNIIYIKNLDPSTDRQSLEDFIRNGNNSIQMASVIHLLNKGEEADLDAEYLAVKQLLSGYFPNQVEQWFTREQNIWQQGLNIKFYLKVPTVNNCGAFMLNYHRSLGHLGTQKLHIIVKEAISFSVAKRVMKAMENPFKRASDMVRGAQQIERKDLEKSNFCQVMIKGEDFVANHHTANILRGMFYGKEVSVVSNRERFIISSTQMKEFCSRIEQHQECVRQSVCIVFDSAYQRIIIHCADEKLTNSIKEAIKIAFNDLFECIDVQEYNIKSINSYVFTVNEGKTDVYLDYTKKKVYIAKDSYLIKVFAREIEKFKMPPNIITEDSCPICFETLTSESSLLYKCLHRFCNGCMKELIKEGREKHETICGMADCKETLTLQDIKEVVPSEDLDQIIGDRINLYLRSNATIYTSCPTTDCKCILLATEDLYDCQSCQTSYCFRIREEPHPIRLGQVCQCQNRDKYRVGINYTPCCRTQFELVPACAHIACACGKHFCIKCYKVFESSTETYAHMRSEHT